MLVRVGEENVEEKDLISKHFPKITVEAPGYTPWSEHFDGQNFILNNGF